MSNVTVDDAGVVTGNTYDKYGSTNPVVRRLMAGFESTLDELLSDQVGAPQPDLGCSLIGVVDLDDHGATLR